MSRRGGGSVAVYTKSGGGGKSRKSSRSVKSGNTNYVFKKSGDGRFELDMFKSGGGRVDRRPVSRRSGYRSSDPGAGGSQEGRRSRRQVPRTETRPPRSRAYSQTRTRTRQSNRRAESIGRRSGGASGRSGGSRGSRRSRRSDRYTKPRTATRTAGAGGGGGSRYKQSQRRSHSASKSNRSASTWRLPPEDRKLMRARDVVACITQHIGDAFSGRRRGGMSPYSTGSVYNSEFGTGKTGTRTLMNMRDTFQAGLDALENNNGGFAAQPQQFDQQPMGAQMQMQGQGGQMGPGASGRSRMSGFGSGKTGTRTLMNMREAFQAGLNALERPGGSPSQGGLTPAFNPAAPMAPNMALGAQMGPGTPAGGAVAPPMDYGGAAGQNLDNIQMHNQQGIGSQAGGMYQQPMGGSQMGYQQYGGSQMGSQGGMPMAGGTPMGSQPPGPMGSQAGGSPAAANQWTNAIGGNSQAGSAVPQGM